MSARLREISARLREITTQLESGEVADDVAAQLAQVRPLEVDDS